VSFDQSEDFRDEEIEVMPDEEEDTRRLCEAEGHQEYEGMGRCLCGARIYDESKF